MFDNNEVYNLLASGFTAEEIAEAFSQSLNDAENRLKAEEEARLEEERKQQQAAAKTENRLDDLVDILRDVYDFLDEYFPDGSKKISEEELREMASTLLIFFDFDCRKENAADKIFTRYFKF